MSQCNGIGWGCTLTGGEQALLIFIVVGIPILVVVSVLVLFFVLRRRENRRDLPANGIRPSWLLLGLFTLLVLAATGVWHR